MFKSYIIVLLVSMKKKNYIFIILVAFSSPVILSTIAMHPSKIQVSLKQPGLVSVLVQLLLTDMRAIHKLLAKHI